VAWLNNFEHGTAQVHFSSVGRYRRGTANMVIDYWRKFRNEIGERTFHVLCGITPETHTTARKLVRITGFTELGIIPSLLHLAYEGRRVGGVISYQEL
jgi:hypothetical protein